MYKQWSFKIWSTIGVLVHLVLIDLPKDIIRWLTLREKNVRDRLIVITGGGSGLGRGMAQILASEKGARVVVLDINKESAQETVDLIARAGGKAHAYFCDITDDDAFKQVADNINQEHGNVDIVICNAAVLSFALFKDFTVEQLRQSLEVNVLGTINTIRAFLPSMEERNSGQIVGVSSIAGFSGETFGLAYCPTKFAVRGVMECLQMELRDRGLDGIVCTTLCPYFSRTPMVLGVGMRPTCTWFPFMSVESCARRMVDAILKEKSISFMPNYVTLVPMIKGLLSVNAARSLRDYLGIEYNPNCEVALSRRRTGSVSAEHFHSPNMIWWLLFFIAIVALTILPAILGSGERIAMSIFLVIFFAHLAEGLYAMILCDELKLSFACTGKWFIQTLCIGYPSLKLLLQSDRRK